MKFFWRKKSESSGSCQFLFDAMCITVLCCLHAYILVAACTLLNIPPESTFITKAATQQAALLLTQCISIMVLFILFILSYMGILRSSFTHHKLICTYLCICCLIFLIRIGLAGFSGKESKLGKDGFEQHEAISIMLVQIIVFSFFRLDIDVVFGMDLLKSPFIKLRTLFGSVALPTPRKIVRSTKGRNSIHSSSAPSYRSEELPAYIGHQYRNSDISFDEEIELRDKDESRK